MTLNTIGTHNVSLSMSSSVLLENQGPLDAPRIRPQQTSSMPIPELDLGKPALDILQNCNYRSVKKFSFFQGNPGKNSVSIVFFTVIHDK